LGNTRSIATTSDRSSEERSRDSFSDRSRIGFKLGASLLRLIPDLRLCALDIGGCRALRVIYKSLTFLQRFRALAFDLPVPVGARVSDGEFVFFQLPLGSSTGGSRQIDVALDQLIPLIQYPTDRSEQQPVQNEYEQHEKDEYDYERPVRVYDVTPAFGKGERSHRVQCLCSC
jgi:hypothetical protein